MKQKPRRTRFRKRRFRRRCEYPQNVSARRRRRRRRRQRVATSATARALPYSRRETLLTQGEAAFHGVLRRAVARHHPPLTISLKTRLADIIHCPPRLWNTAHGRRLSQKHIDFVLYDSLSTRIVAAIELDDRSHQWPERRRRDEFVDAAFAAAGIPLIRIRAAYRYEVEAIVAVIAEARQCHST